ncbi:MAG: hypothetical protein F2667_11110 [Actinobacteria bacterium]|uniref:Unannotated protein n=1 Tax=freshwater metagenome TaxID=449393 RepID=A0A6J6RMQ4_9ZZZZ|nr:hypothetical protein [Actinomycetota bacterium]
MGYGIGAFLLAAGLVLALAVEDTVSGVDLAMIGWILAAVGLVSIVLTAVTLNSGRRAGSRTTVTHPDGSQTVREQRTEI